MQQSEIQSLDQKEIAEQRDLQESLAEEVLSLRQQVEESQAVIQQTFLELEDKREQYRLLAKQADEKEAHLISVIGKLEGRSSGKDISEDDSSDATD